MENEYWGQQALQDLIWMTRERFKDLIEYEGPRVYRLGRTMCIVYAFEYYLTIKRVGTITDFIHHMDKMYKVDHNSDPATIANGYQDELDVLIEDFRARVPD